MPVTITRSVEVGFRAQASNNNIRNVDEESLMLTGDENIVDINFVVQWFVSDAAKYVFNIRNPEKNVKDSAPNAHIDGIMISPMKNGDIECILGAKIDPVFGPIVMFGLGGIYAEVMKDIVFAEAPVSEQKAEQMILSLKSKDIFYGARGKPPIEINSLLNAIINLSNFIAANPTKAVEKIRKDIIKASNQVRAGGDIKKMKTLKLKFFL